MDKNYDHKESEAKIYAEWEKSGVFAPPSGEEVIRSGKKTYSIIMPPPNANDPLHVGHAMFVTVEDIFARFHRMKGEVTLWLPGTDHAGIETQFVFEKKLAKEGKSRFDFDRDTLYKLIWDYVQENSGVAIDQMKRLGASADWSRYKYTLDPDIVKLVQETFIELSKRGLVYKSERLVNFCTKCGTAYSELEVEYEEREDKIYTIDYGSIQVATTRPETMLGDVAVAVNPNDTRYTHRIGSKLELPLTKREIPIIADELVDKEFGTGAVKITPSHDRNDWEMAERQKMNLQEICALHTVIGENGKMNSNAGVYEGMSVLAARERILEDLGEKVVEIKPIVHNVGTCYRCHRIIEPLPRSQFFIKVKGMAQKALKAMDDGEVEIIGSGHDKILRHWLENLRDWNVSRQIVWGIRMPVWYRTQELKNSRTQDEEYVVSETSPGEDYTQETDTFDTWFSSGQWPVVTLKTNKAKDFETFYPTQLMETAYDILPFWVMRMMMLGIYMTGKSPFKVVYLHGLVRDEKGRKMSKSVGNVINPLELTDKYGADSLRMALVMSTTAGQDSNTGENKVRGMRNFCNKIWNAGRFVQSFDGKAENNFEFETFYSRTVPFAIKQHLDNHRIGLAAELVYDEFWHNFCDKYIEEAKAGNIGSMQLKLGLKNMLIVLHPFVPFVTEAVWKEVFPNEGLLISQSWPK